MADTNNHKAAKPMVWIKDSEGDTWICPVGAIKDLKGASRQELESACMNESENPQNN
ncbi:MAG: hypothetical protein ACYTG7_12295 [Planctomycetota bacterium]|jgi:hypothetical protein